MNAHHDIRPLDRNREATECAELMVTTEPWITLRVSSDAALATLTDPVKEVHAIQDAKGVAGFEQFGVLREFVVPGHDEVLLRKTRGPWTAFHR